MAAAAGKSKEADPAQCRRHPRHRHSAGVCPFCLRDRLARLSASARAGANASSSSSSAASSPCSSWEESVLAPSLGLVPPRRRRERLGMLLRQEGREAAAAAAAALGAGRREGEEERKAKKGNFWARLQHQLHHGGWHRKDGCSVAAEKSAAAATAPHKRAPVA